MCVLSNNFAFTFRKLFILTSFANIKKSILLVSYNLQVTKLIYLKLQTMKHVNPIYSVSSDPHYRILGCAPNILNDLSTLHVVGVIIVNDSPFNRCLINVPLTVPINAKPLLMLLICF